MAKVTQDYAERNIICFRHKDDDRHKFYWVPMRRCVYWYSITDREWNESFYVPKQVADFLTNGSWMQADYDIPASALRKWLTC